MTDPLAERLHLLECVQSPQANIPSMGRYAPDKRPFDVLPDLHQQSHHKRADEIRAFLAERVTVDAIKKAMAGSCPHGQGARRACATCSAYRALGLLRREVGG